MRHEKGNEQHEEKLNIIKRIWIVFSQKKGTTLIELVVTFALIAIFTAGISQVISNSMKTYYQIRTLDNAEQVIDTLMDKITGEIEGARPSMTLGETNTSNEKTLYIYNNGTIIDLIDRTGSHIAITSTNYKNNIDTFSGTLSTSTYSANQLLVCYDEVLLAESEEEGGTKILRYEPVDWTFDIPSYMGFQIHSLTFALAGSEYPDNVIRVDLTISGNGNGYGSFSATRYVECYNFISPEDLDKIGTDGT